MRFSFLLIPSSFFGGVSEIYDAYFQKFQPTLQHSAQKLKLVQFQKPKYFCVEFKYQCFISYFSSLRSPVQYCMQLSYSQEFLNTVDFSIDFFYKYFALFMESSTYIVLCLILSSLQFESSFVYFSRDASASLGKQCSGAPTYITSLSNCFYLLLLSELLSYTTFILELGKHISHTTPTMLQFAS